MSYTLVQIFLSHLFNQLKHTAAQTGTFQVFIMLLWEMFKLYNRQPVPGFINYGARESLAYLLQLIQLCVAACNALICTCLKECVLKFSRCHKEEETDA